MDYKVDSNDDIMKTMSNLIAANNKFIEAKSSASKSINEGENIAKFANAIVKSIDELINGNTYIIDEIKKSGKRPENFDNLLRMAHDKNRATGGLIFSGIYSLNLFMGPKEKNKNPNDKLPFKISEEERKLILKRIDTLFADRLKPYDDNKTFKKQGEQYLDSQSSLLSYIRILRDTLSCETYEEWAKVDNVL